MMRYFLAVLLLCVPRAAAAQWTAVNGGATLPMLCHVGDVFLTTTAPSVSRCNVENVWTTVVNVVPPVWGVITGTLANQTDLQSALNLKANLVSPSFTTPALGVATGTSVAVTGSVTSSGTAGIGYATGAGGTVTQATSKSTGVTINKVCGTITLHNSTLGNAATVTFTVTNSTVQTNDVIVLQHDAVGTFGVYTLVANTSAAGSFKITIRNNGSVSLSEAIVIRFVVVKAVAS